MKIKQYIKGHAGLVTMIAILMIITMVIAGRKAGQKVAESSDANVKQVTLVEASMFRDDLSTVSVNGIVESVSQADIKSQISAPIASVNVKVGDMVSVGQIIAQFHNADIRAQLDQARANLELVRGLDVKGGSDSIRRSTVDKILEVYVKMDDVVNTQIAQFLFTGNSNQEQLQSGLTDRFIADDLSAQWTESQDVFRNWKKSTATLSPTSSKEEIEKALAVSNASLQKISSFLDVVSRAVNDRTQSSLNPAHQTLSSWRTTVIGARSTASSAISSITSAGTALSNMEFQVSIAEAGVRNLEAQLTKTVITSPIQGKVAALPLRVGEFASMGQLITTIVGPGGFQVKAFASSEDINRLAKGAKVTISGGIPGVVDSVAPSINQLNKKVEVKIFIPPSEGDNLVVGQDVQAKIVSKISPVITTSSFYLLPIQNVKIVPGEAYVYTLDTASKVIKNKVTLGEVKGDYIEIKAGITDDMKIISPVYELEEGEVVKI